MSVLAGLARRSVGGGVLWAVAVTASSPMTVLAGGVVATFAGTGVVGVPLSFVVIAAGLGPMLVAYVAAGRYLPHPAMAYALVAHGLGRTAAVAAGLVALVSYNAIQVSLFGLLGATLAGLAGGVWWAWALAAWAVVALLGVLNVVVNARLLAWLLVAQLGVIGVLDVVALRHPAEGSYSLAGLDPGRLLVDGLGGVLALGVAAFIGVESTAVYGEEARTPRTVGRATLAALVWLGVFYAFSAWALTVAVGPEAVVDAARDPGGGLPFSVLAAHLGPGAAAGGVLVLLGAVVAAMLSFHHGVARYVFALGRERVLPAALARVGAGRGGRGGAPVAGSLTQSGIALAVVALAALVGVDPFATLFTWLSTLAAVGVLALLTACSWAARRFFRHGGGTQEGRLVRVVAPSVGVVCGLVMGGTLVANTHALLGVAPGAPLTLVPPGLVGLSALVGLGWGWWLRRHRPGVYAGIGRGMPHPLAIPDQRLTELKV